MEHSAKPEAHGLGYIPDPPSDEDLTWRAVVFPKKQDIPASYRRKRIGPVLDQKDKPHCVAFSSASLKMHHEWVQHKKYYTFDPAWLYDLCKKEDGIPNQDGTFIKVALKIIQDPGYLAKAAPKVLKKDTNFKIDHYVRLTSMRQMKEAIYHVGPVVFGIEVDEGIYKPNHKGRIPEPGGESMGGHAMLAVGYDDKNKAFLVKNSWGKHYGINGLIWLPYSHFEKYEGWDAWRTVDAKDDLNLLIP